MKIGATLKSYRKQKKLTQKEFIQDVISESYYSKVENDQHRITAEDLLQLLTINNISFQEFASQLDICQQPSSFKELKNKLYMMFFDNQLNDLDTLSMQAQQDPKLTPDEKKLFLTLANIVLKNKHHETTSSLSAESKVFLKEKIMADDKWSDNSLAIYANTIHAYDFEENIAFLQLLLKERSLQQFIEPLTKRSLIFATILLNFVSICIDQKALPFTQKPLQILDELPKTPEYTFYRLLTVFFKELIQRMTIPGVSSNKLETIINSFTYIGREDFAQILRQIIKDNC